jgi:acetyl esterase/lipase
MTRIILIILVLLNLSCKAQKVIPLYDGTPPFSLPVEDKETGGHSTAGNKRYFVTNVTNPTITVFLPKKITSSGTAIIICPGGGYSRLSIEDGGYEAAKALAEYGIVGIVLKYRTQRDDAYTSYKLAPLRDLQQAINLVYTNAKEWEIDTTHLGILGFSAGGHLTAMAVTTMQWRKPAFTLLAYPVISFMDSLTSEKSNTRNNLLGKKVSEPDKIAWSPELHVSATTPPAYLVHAEDDETSLVGNSITYYNRLIENKIAAQLVLYKKGGHGFALYNKAEDKYWMPDAVKWLKDQGYYEGR